MAKRNVSEIETGAGFFMGFVSATMDVVREKAYPFAAIYRLVTAVGRMTLVKIVDLAYADWQAEQRKSAEPPEGGHPYRGGPHNGNAPFSAPIVYIQPEFEELQLQFPTCVNPDYEGLRFEPIEGCEVLSKESREVAFEYVCIECEMLTDEILAEMDRKGLRPALYEELLGFAKKYPDEQLKHPIFALGSETGVNNRRRVAYLWGGRDNGRRLFLYWSSTGYYAQYRFLAVPKSQLSTGS